LLLPWALEVHHINVWFPVITINSKHILWNMFELMEWIYYYIWSMEVRTLPVMDSISSLAFTSGWSELILELESERTETTSSELGSDECIEFREPGSEWSLNRNLGADEDSICIWWWEWLLVILIMKMKRKKKESN
jgi:hypothetical protein